MDMLRTTIDKPLSGIRRVRRYWHWRLHSWCVSECIDLGRADPIEPPNPLPPEPRERSSHSKPWASTYKENRLPVGKPLEMVRAYLAEHGPSINAEIAEATGLQRGTLNWQFRNHPDVFESIGRRANGKATAMVWALRTEE